MAIEKDDKRLVFIPIDKAIQPKPGICRCYADMWWVVDDRGILFWQPKKGGSRYPQCNPNKLVTEKVLSKMYPWSKVEFIPLVFESVDIMDYV